MKFTITNKSPYLRSVPTPGDRAVEIAGEGTIVLDYPKGCKYFFEGLKNYQFDVVSEPSDLDSKIDKRVEELKNAPKADASDQVSQIDKPTSSRVAKIVKVFSVPKSSTPVATPAPAKQAPLKVNKVAAPKVEATPKAEEVKVEDTRTPEVKEEVKTEEAKNTASTKEAKSEVVVDPDDPMKAIKTLNADQLKAVCDKLGLATNSNKESTLINKIDRSSASNEDIIKAYKEVVENA